MRSWMLGMALCLGSGVAQAAGWVLVGTDGDMEHYVDDGSLLRTDEVVRVDKRVIYRKPHPLGDTPGMPLIRETRGVVECDCDRKQHRAVSLSIIGLSNEVLWSSGDMKRVWETIDAGSPGRATLDFACERSAGPRAEAK